MNTRRLMLIGLDGFEPTLADGMIARGLLPCMAALRDTSASAVLDHGLLRNTGLAWEHFSTGMAPQDSDHWSSVHFDTARYRFDQRGTRLLPFATRLDCRTVVFDPPYFDLGKVPGARGLTNWGAHDPGVAAQCNPPGLAAEVIARFGAYPAAKFIYGFVWNCAERTREMGRALVAATERRTEIAEWLFGEKCPDWELGIIVAGEPHSAIEALWHGVDSDHPLYGLPSAAPAREAIEALYIATDRMIARLMARFPEADFAVFNYHGMGTNQADVASMALLPELLHRAAFGQPMLRAGSWERLTNGTPVFGNETDWSREVNGLMPRRQRLRSLMQRVRVRLGLGTDPDDAPPLSWMPLTRYARFWPRMPWFALPAYYTGNIRINLAGREAAGIVPPGDYAQRLDELEALLGECTDPLTGQGVIAEMIRSQGDPLERGPTHCDLRVEWNQNVLGLHHPRHGTIGPLPWRRTGGHTGGDGFAWFTGPNLRAKRLERRASIDVTATVVELMGGDPEGLSGTSFADQLGPRQAQPLPA